MPREAPDHLVGVRVDQLPHNMHVRGTTSTAAEQKKDRSDRRGGKACCGPPATRCVRLNSVYDTARQMQGPFEKNLEVYMRYLFCDPPYALY
jgi:hypothetical protein